MVVRVALTLRERPGSEVASTRHCPVAVSGAVGLGFCVLNCARHAAVWALLRRFVYFRCKYALCSVIDGVWRP